MDIQMTYAVMYLEINVISLILIWIIRYKTTGISQMVAQRNFALAIDCQTVFFLSDTLYVMMKCNVLPYSRGAAIVSKEIYFFTTALMCYFWFVYFEHMQDSPFVKNKRTVIWSSFLVWIMGILLVINLFTGILFYIDADDVYHRGSLFVIQYILSYIYVIFTCSRALLGVFKKQNEAKKKRLLLLTLFPVAPAGAGILQFVFPEIPTACAALSLATLVMYLNWTDEMISIDPLTKLNNRKQLIYQYEQHFGNGEEDAPLYLLLVDANRFKGINDTYGHNEGDAALVRIADAMRLGCKGFQKRAVIARYGGDEFVILAWTDKDEMVEKLQETIRVRLAKLNREANAPYELTVSFGIAQAKKNMPLKALLEEADKKLYEEKAKLKGERRA